MTVKVAILFRNYGPYHLARLQSFLRYCAYFGWEGIGIELTRLGEDYEWKTHLESFPGSVISVLGKQQLREVSFFQLVKQLYKVIENIQPDLIVIAGYSRPSMLAALGWSRLKQKPAILLSASKEDDSYRSFVTEALKKAIVSNYKAALVGGKPQKRYCIKLGIPAERIFLGYNVVGNEVFHPQKISSLRKPFNFPYFLAINRFIPKKNLLFLLSSYNTYYKKAGEKALHLVLCGDGELRPQIEKKIKELDLSNLVHLTGFLQQDELLPYFAHASGFVHASIQEQWGLVVNEAMAAGLPVLVSNRCGCYEDLVIEGITGFGFDPENSQQLTSLMLKMTSGEVELSKMGNAALEHIQKFSPNYFAKGLSQAIQYTLNH